MTTRISYIDGEHLETESAKQTWTVPSDKSIVQMEPAKAILGQPVYIDGMFFGSEFPETDTQIVDGRALPLLDRQELRRL